MQPITDIEAWYKERCGGPCYVYVPMQNTEEGMRRIWEAAEEFGDRGYDGKAETGNGA